MTRWKKASTRRPGRGRQHGAVPSGRGRGAVHAKDRPAVAVDEYDDLILLRPSADAPPRPDGIAELARFLRRENAVGPNVFTVVVGADGADGDLWNRLSGVLDSLRDRGVTRVRLALSGAGAERGGRPALAQRIADAWGFEVIAPDAGVIIVPGGSLFALGAAAADRGWRSFTPGAEPTPLGPRSPAPDWQPDFARLPGRTAGGYVVEQVPAGILVRSARSARTPPDDLGYAVPVDDVHPTVLLSASESSGEADVPAEDIAALLAALPDTTRSVVRLAPCGPADLLPVGQDTAELLGSEVEVLTGLPLLIGTEDEPEVRPVLIGADAEPTWAPFVEAVACRPYDADGTAEPRVVRWRSPMSGIRRTDPAPVRLSDRWQVCVTRAGLAVGPRGEEPSVAGRPVSSEKLAVEVDLRGGPADDALFADLSRLLSEMGTGVREFVGIHRILPAGQPEDEDFRLLRLAIDHGVSLAESPPAEAAPAPAGPTVRTVAIPRDVALPRDRQSREPSAYASESPAPARTASAAGTPDTAPPAREAVVAADGPAAPAYGGLPAPGAEAYAEAGDGGPLPANGARVPSGTGAVKPGVPAAGDAPAAPADRGPSAPEGAAYAGSGDALPGNGGPTVPEGESSGTGPSAPEPGVAAAGDAPATPDVPAAREPEDETTGDGATHASGDPSVPSTGEPVEDSGRAPAGTSPLPPSLGGIPLTPVTPARPAEPDSPGTAAERALSSGQATPPEPATVSGPETPAEAAESAPAEPPASPAHAQPTVSPAPARPTVSAEPGTPARPPAAPAPSPAAPPAKRPRPVAKPVRRSTDTERSEFRTLAQPVWERHSAAVNRAMTRMPALRGAQVDAARTDLVAVHLYLSDEQHTIEQPDAGGYTACLASGLCRLPSYRGVAVRGGLPDGGLERFMPGTVLHESGPVSALPLGAAGGLPATAGGYVIWSATARRVRPLLGSATNGAADEVVFPPDVAFRVLDVRSSGPVPVVLLTEVLGSTPVDERPGGLDESDRATLEKLDEALRRQESSAGASPASWPARCTEPLGGTAGRP